MHRRRLHPLDTTARGLIKNRVNALLGRRHRLLDPSDWHPRDVLVARWYAPLMLVGYAWMLFTLAVLVAPLVARFRSRRPLLP